VKLQHVNDWMKLIGNLGVFAGLVLVALQMQQANHIARSEQQAERDKAYQDMEIGIMGENAASAWVKSEFDPASMTREEMRIMDAYLINEFIVIRRTAIREAAGLEPEGAAKLAVENSAPYFFSSDFARIWWKYEQKNQVDTWPNLVKYMNETIEKTDRNGTAKWWLRIEKELRELPPVTAADLN
jgi:hypothetical protein